MVARPIKRLLSVRGAIAAAAVQHYFGFFTHALGRSVLRVTKSVVFAVIALKEHHFTVAS